MDTEVYTISLFFKKETGLKPLDIPGALSYDIGEPWVIVRGDGWKNMLSSDSIQQIIIMTEEKGTVSH